MDLSSKYLVHIEFFLLLSVQVQFGVIQYISNVADFVHVSWKRLIVERNRQKFLGLRAKYVEYIPRVLLTVMCSSSV